MASPGRTPRRPGRHRRAGRRWRPCGAAASRSRPPRSPRLADSKRATWAARSAACPRRAWRWVHRPARPSPGAADDARAAATRSTAVEPAAPEPGLHLQLDRQRPRRIEAAAAATSVEASAGAHRQPPRSRAGRPRRPTPPGPGRARGSGARIPPSRSSIASSKVATQNPSAPAASSATRDGDRAVAVGVGLDDRLGPARPGRPGRAAPRGCRAARRGRSRATPSAAAAAGRPRPGGPRSAARRDLGHPPRVAVQRSARGLVGARRWRPALGRAGCDPVRGEPEALAAARRSAIAARRLRAIADPVGQVRREQARVAEPLADRRRRPARGGRRRAARRRTARDPGRAASRSPRPGRRPSRRSRAPGSRTARSPPRRRVRR